MNKTRHGLSILILGLALAGCGGGSGGTNDSNPDPDPGPGPGPGPAPTPTSALLSWTPPSQNEDGSGLSAGDLAGYKIYMGTQQNVYSLVDTTQSNVSTHLVENLSPGTTYFFVVTAFDSAGNESQFSNVASKDIQ